MPVDCCYCNKTFSSQSNVNRHIREVHPESDQHFIKSYPYEDNLYKCLEGCEISFKFNRDLRNHLNLKHNFQMSSEKWNFEKMEDFEEWLSNSEIENDIKYCKPRGIKRTQDNAKTIYLQCSRSGRQKILSTEHRKRRERLQGSVKLDLACTSQIILTEKDNGEFVAEYFKDHYGHEYELRYLNLSENFRKDIASQLMMGVTPQDILTSVRENFAGTIKRDDLITMKDIDNIKKTFKIFPTDNQQHKDDLSSEENSNSPLSLSPVPESERKEKLMKNAALQLIENINHLHYTEDHYDFILKNLQVLNSLGAKSETSKEKKIDMKQTNFSKKGKFTKKTSKPIYETIKVIIETSPDSENDHEYVSN